MERGAQRPRQRDGRASRLIIDHLLPFPALRVNAAETAVAAFMVIVQVGEDPKQPPPVQPVKKALLFGVAVSVTSVALGYAPEQTEPQLIPEGVLVTVPGPDVATARG